MKKWSKPLWLISYLYDSMIQKVDILLPCYNPPVNWAGTVASCFKEISDRNPSIEFSLIIANDGSTNGISKEDLTFLEQSISSFFWVTYVKNEGKGFALRKGLSQSKAPICIYTDIDFPYTIPSFQKILDELLKEEVDIVSGIRRSSYYEKVPFIRTMISKTLKWLIRKFLRISITDTQCGLKGFNHNGKALYLATTINRYLFDLEFIYRSSHAKGIKIKPVEVTLKEGVVFTRMNMKVLASEAGNFLKILFGK